MKNSVASKAARNSRSSLAASRKKTADVAPCSKMDTATRAGDALASGPPTVFHTTLYNTSMSGCQAFTGRGTTTISPTDTFVAPNPGAFASQEIGPPRACNVTRRSTAQSKLSLTRKGTSENRTEDCQGPNAGLQTHVSNALLKCSNIGRLRDTGGIDRVH